MASLRPRPGILEIEPYVGGKAELAGGMPVDQAVVQRERARAKPEGDGGLRQAVAAQLHRYPDGGATALRAAIGRRYSLDPERHRLRRRLGRADRSCWCAPMPGRATRCCTARTAS